MGRTLSKLWIESGHKIDRNLKLTSKMIFRWSIWGNNKEADAKMLIHSIASFRHFFGATNDFVVFTDDSKFISKCVCNLASVIQYDSFKNIQFFESSKATWLKWCPVPRLNINENEFHIDCDVFLVNYPAEIFRFINDKNKKFLILSESLGADWQFGSMRQRVRKNMPFINAGFFVQKCYSDISENLLREFNWWKLNVPFDKHTHHDEQGSLAAALYEYFFKNELGILPKDRYCVASPRSNPNLNDLSEVAMIHATYLDHPAFRNFYSEINKITHQYIGRATP